MTSRNDRVLLLVGRLNYTWTNTESLLIYVMEGLMGTSKEVAIVTFLTLNTTRARIELIERLAKLGSVGQETRARILDITARMKRASRMRNKYNHSIYSFDERGEIESTQLLRIAEFGEDVKYGKVESIDDAEIARIDATIAEISDVNKAIWRHLKNDKA